MNIDYNNYLQSSHWLCKKQEHYSTHPNRRKCYICKVANQCDVHHLTYTNLGKEKLSDLVTLCREHHTEVHRINKVHQTNYRFSLKILKYAFSNKITNLNEVIKILNGKVYLPVNIPISSRRRKFEKVRHKYLRHRSQFYPTKSALES